VIHLTSNPVDWYLIRASGIVAYILLTGAVAIGIGLAGKERLERWPRFALTDVHRFVGMLVGVFVALHVVTLAIDAFLPFSVSQIVVPFTASYRPVWTALGIVGAELLLALALTNRFRHRLSYRFWRRAHYLNFAVWAAATAHGIGAGTDSASSWNVLLYGVAVALVTGLVVRRVARARGGGAYRAGPELLASAGFAALVVGLLVTVPLGGHGVGGHGVGGQSAAARAKSSTTAATAPRAVQDTLTGQIVNQSGRAEELVSLTGRGAGSSALLVRVDLLASAQSLDSTSLQLEFLPSGTRCTGTVTKVASSSFDGKCSLRDGSARTVHAEWSGTGGNSLRGTISATTA
jgi:methionine sulfoxide reductase heme-binding subunit